MKVPASEYENTFFNFNFKTVDILLNNEGVKVQPFNYVRMAYTFNTEKFSTIEFECAKDKLYEDIFKDMILSDSHVLVATLKNNMQVVVMGYFREFINNLQYLSIKFEIHDIFVKEESLL